MRSLYLALTATTLLRSDIFINRSTHFICLSPLLIDKCILRLVAYALESRLIGLSIVQIEFHVIRRFCAAIALFVHSLTYSLACSPRTIHHV